MRSRPIIVPRRAGRASVDHVSVEHRLVYCWCMARTNIDIDEEACEAVMHRYHLETKRDAVNFALRTLAAEPLDLDGARDMRGSGWEGDLEELRTSRVR